MRAKHMKKTKFRFISKPGRTKKPAKPVQPVETEYTFDVDDILDSQPQPQPRPPQPQPQPQPQPRPLQPQPQPRPQPRPRPQSQARPPQPQPQKKRRSYGFLIFLLVFVVLALGGIYAGAVYLWDYLEAYEVSRPEHIIEEMSENIDLDFWRQSVENALAKQLGHFETDTAAALEPHLSHILDVRYSIRLRPEESTDELLVYTVRAGASDIGIVRFTPMEEAGHGMYIWGVGGMELLESFIDPFSRSITITASQNAVVEVNGIPVTDEYMIPCEYEHGSTYQINNLYGNVTVTVIEFDGQRPEAIFADNDEYYFPITIPFSLSYNFIVPYRAIVYADDERISSENITDPDIMFTQIFKGIVQQSSLPSMAYSRYKFDISGIYTQPVIKVTDAGGTELKATKTDDGDTVYKEEYSETLKETHAETAENFMRAYVRFSSNVGGDPNVNLNSLASYMQRNSALYRHLQSAVITRSWPRSSQITFHEVSADKFKQYGDNYITCEVYYNLTQRGHIGTVNVEMRHEVLLVRTGNRWLVANVLAID